MAHYSLRRIHLLALCLLFRLPSVFDNRVSRLQIRQLFVLSLLIELVILSRGFLFFNKSSHCNEACYPA